jgi:hypothetical protein
MLRTPILAALLLAISAFAMAQSNQLPQPLSRAISATQGAQTSYLFDFDYASGAENFSARFDPRAQPRLRLLAPNRDALSADMRESFDYFAETLSGVTWCAGAHMAHVANARLLREDETTATYSFQPTRESVTGAQTRRVVSHLRGEFTLNKASSDVTRIRLFAPRPFSPALGANVEIYALTTTCAAAPNGRYYGSEIVHESRGSAFGRPFNVRTVRRLRDVRGV